MKNKIYHAIGRFFQKVSRWFFHRTLMACWHCGALVGMNSTYTRGHMWCEPCLQRYVMPELHAAQQRAHLTAFGVDQAALDAKDVTVKTIFRREIGGK